MFHKDSSKLEIMDPEIFKIIGLERARQEDGLELIASENYTSQAVMQAQGSILTNKYAEGLPHKRYYGGCEFVDQAETLAIERVNKLYTDLYTHINLFDNISKMFQKQIDTLENRVEQLEEKKTKGKDE